jgi:uncharacterized Zn-binding protein involved in type VI secretion
MHAMGQPAAKQGDQVLATDIHTVMTPSGPAAVPHPFTGVIDGGLSRNVNIMGLAAAMVDSTASNKPPHAPLGGPFQRVPDNQATLRTGSASVKINGRRAARSGDKALTCNEGSDQPIGIVRAAGTVNIG